MKEFDPKEYEGFRDKHTGEPLFRVRDPSITHEELKKCPFCEGVFAIARKGEVLQ